MPSASERIATTVTNGVLNSVRRASVRFRMIRWTGRADDSLPRCRAEWLLCRPAYQERNLIRLEREIRMSAKLRQRLVYATIAAAGLAACHSAGRTSSGVP